MSMYISFLFTSLCGICFAVIQMCALCLIIQCGVHVPGIYSIVARFLWGCIYVKYGLRWVTLDWKMACNYNWAWITERGRATRFACWCCFCLWCIYANHAPKCIKTNRVVDVFVVVHIELSIVYSYMRCNYSIYVLGLYATSNKLRATCLRCNLYVFFFLVW